MWSSHVSEMLCDFTFLVQKMRAWVQYSIGAFCSFLQLLVRHGSKCQGDSGENHGHAFHPGGTETGVRGGRQIPRTVLVTGLTAWVCWLWPAVSQALSTWWVMPPSSNLIRPLRNPLPVQRRQVGTRGEVVTLSLRAERERGVLPRPLALLPLQKCSKSPT